MAKIADFYAELGLKKDKFDKGMKEAGNAPQQLQPKFAALGGAIAAAFSVGAITAFTRQVITVTAEFQKYQAVLTNTLGSSRKAEQSMQMLTDIASKTPFSVQELTSAYVKLVNQGFKPSNEEMIKLGDLASSTGKSFDQLAEAVIDATTGQFERLKEFGIKAEKNGNMVAFSFKGVRTEVEYTNDAIQDYMLSLGDVQGVTGSMAAISETLQGKISNLGDTWDQFLLHLGDNNNSTINSVIDALSWLIRVADKGFNTSAADIYNEEAGKEIIESATAYTRMAEEAEKAKEEAKKLLEEQRKAADLERKKAEEERKAAAERKKAQDAALDEYKKRADAVREQIQLQEDNNETLKEWYRIILETPITKPEPYKPDVSLDEEGETNDIGFDTEAYLAQVEAAAQAVKDKYNDFIDDMNAMTEQFVEGMIGGIADGIADLITGDTTLEGFFLSILDSFGKFMQEMGAAIIAYGVAMDAFKKAFANPVTAIIAGAALIVIGGIISNLASAGPSTAGMSGGGSGNSYTGHGNSGGTYGHYTDDKKLVAEIDGQRLLIMIESAKRTSARQGRI